MASPIARKLRSSATDVEKLLWRHLRLKQIDGFKFRRQTPIGSYVVDFFCPTAKLIIELDGGQHAEQADIDAIRAAWLGAAGYRVVRFWNNDVLENIDGVLQHIQTTLASAERPPTPTLPLKGGGRSS
jgi:very-short-patch-repair endonuclease